MSRVPYGLVPLYPYIYLDVGGICLTETPQSHVMDFSFERKGFAVDGYTASKFNFTLFDETALYLEDVLAKGRDSIKFRYGYNNNPEYSSLMVYGRVQDYSLTFEAGGITLDISGATSSASDNIGTQATKSYLGSEYGGKRSVVVEAVAKEMNWKIGKIEETVVEVDDSGNPRSFNRKNQTAIQFIKSLCEDAVSASVQNPSAGSGYQLRFDSEDKIYFVSTDTLLSENKDRTVSNTYEYYCGKADQAVLSFSPDFKGNLAFAQYGSVSVEGVDKISNTILNDSSLGRRSKIGKTSYHTVMGMSSTMVDTLRNRVNGITNLYSSYGYTATLEVIGEPKTEIMEKVKVFVYTKLGVLHHTSGTYTVMSVTDSINGGTFTTNMSLRKDSDIEGNVRGKSMQSNLTENSTSTSSTPIGPQNQVNVDNCGVANSPKVENAVQWAVGISSDGLHGYDQRFRTGPDYDCSSLVCSAYRQSGINVPITSTSYMHVEFPKAGFKWYAGTPNVSVLQRGDVLWRQGHTEMYIGDGKNVGAHVAENGKAIAGQSGDQTGKEISVSDFIRSGTWAGFFRYEG